MSSLADPEALARLLLRAEAVASSHREGLVIGGRRLLHAEAASALGEPNVDVTAIEVLNNINAMDYAIQNLVGVVTIDGILGMHRLLLAGTRQERYGGRRQWSYRSGAPPCGPATFASASTRAAIDARSFEDRIEALEASWRERLGRARARSTTAELLDRLPGTPIVTGDEVANLTGRSLTAAYEAIDWFVLAGILTQITLGRRNRAWEATEIIGAFSDFDRALAAPSGDTLSAAPSRPVSSGRG